jgi:hypothetical protein
MSTATDLQAEFVKDFLDDDFFGEDIVYHNDIGDYSIGAVVYRPGLTASKQSGGRSSGSNEIRYHVEIRISRADIPVIVEKSDSVSVSLKLGETLSIFRVAAIINQDLGTWHLGLNR